MKRSEKYKNMTYKYLPVLALLLGVALRVIYLGDIPGGYHRDEAYGAWNAFSLYKDGIDSAGHSYPVYFEAWAHGQNALNSYLMLPLIFLSGGHINTLVVRIPQVIISILTLIAVYSMIKKMFTRQTAIWALFLLSICPWHVMMSRWGLESNLAPGFLIFGLCFWIHGLDNSKYFLLSALSYGLSLYCYATIWPIVPVMILLQFAYSLYTRKIRLDKWLLISGCILAALGLPLVLFLMVNMGLLPEFKIGCFSVYRMTSFRSGELVHSFSDILKNIRNLISLLWRQDVGRPYDVIMPHGFFYDIGRFFAVIGAIIIVIRVVLSLMIRRFSYEIFIVIQLIGAAIVGCLITVSMTQINCLYIPVVLCQAIGIEFILHLISQQLLFTNKSKLVTPARSIATLLILCIYLINLADFQHTYYTDYKALVSAHFQEGADMAVRFAQKAAKDRNLSVSVNEGLKYPHVLLATETGAAEYLDTLVYSEALPAPKQFDCDGVTFYMSIDYENISDDMAYVLYFTDITFFEDYDLTQFHDWYVAVPRAAE